MEIVRVVIGDTQEKEKGSERVSFVAPAEGFSGEKESGSVGGRGSWPRRSGRVVWLWI